MKTINEKALLNLNFTPKVDTTDLTIGAYVTPAAGGSAILLGTVAGGAANVEYTIECNFTSPQVGSIYHLEVIAGVGGSNPIMLLPDDSSGRPIRVRIGNIEAVS